MKTRKITVYVDSDLDVDVDEVLDELTEDELIGEVIKRGKLNNRSRNGLKVFIREMLSDDGIPTSLYDEMKFDVLKEAFNKFNLDELERRLK